MQLPSIPLKKRQWLKKARETRPKTLSTVVSILGINRGVILSAVSFLCGPHLV